MEKGICGVTVRKRYEQELKNLRLQVIEMGSLVDNEFSLALQALEFWDMHLAGHVLEAEKKVNVIRYDIEKVCFTLISTQQPLAGDLRVIVAVMNIIIDLERIGDKAKNIVETIPHLRRTANYERPTDLITLGDIVHSMFRACMEAYTHDDAKRISQISIQEAEVDMLFANILHRLIEDLAKARQEKMVTAEVGLLQAAQQLERVGDLVTNIAERIIYMKTGTVHELNADSEHSE